MENQKKRKVYFYLMVLLAFFGLLFVGIAGYIEVLDKLPEYKNLYVWSARFGVLTFCLATIMFLNYEQFKSRWSEAKAATNKTPSKNLKQKKAILNTAKRMMLTGGVAFLLLIFLREILKLNSSGVFYQVIGAFALGTLFIGFTLLFILLETDRH